MHSDMTFLALIYLTIQPFLSLVSWPLTVVHSSVLCAGLGIGDVCIYVLQCAAEMQHTTFNTLLQCLSSFPFSLPSQLAATPSPVRNLTVNVVFDVTKSKIFANLSWVGPERPYGKIDHYQIVLSSPKALSLIGSTTLHVKVIFKGKQHPLRVIFMFICLLRNISMPTGYDCCYEYGTAVGGLR